MFSILKSNSFISLIMFVNFFLAQESKTIDENQARKFLQELDLRYTEEASTRMETRWKYLTNLTDHNYEAYVQAHRKFHDFQYESWRNLTRFDWNNFNDQSIKREFMFLSLVGPAALDEIDLRRYNQLVRELETIHGSVTTCPLINPCNSTSEAGLAKVKEKSDSYNELQHAWIQRREKYGKPMREKILEFVELNSKAAKRNGHSDIASLRNAYHLYDGFTEDQFKATVDDLWRTIRPFYLEIYTYVRRIMYQRYPRRFQRYGRVPVHILGDIWKNIKEEVLPFDDTESLDATAVLKTNNYTVEEIFHLSESFFHGLGFNFKDLNWEKSLLQKPGDRPVDCCPSAEDFFIDKTTKTRTDFRIKMCVRITHEDLLTAHRVMGRIAYFTQYKDQPWIFRSGANPGFLDAVSDCVALAVGTTSHLGKMGLLENSINRSTKGSPRFKELPPLPEGVTPTDMNYLLKQALEKMSFLPFTYLMDKYQRGIYHGEITTGNLNSAWWNLRKEYEGLIPPVERSENDFDPGAEYLIPFSTEPIKYFVGSILQFQLYESLCRAAGKYYPENPNCEPLYQCDFANSLEAGKKLMDMMSLGSSKPWPDALEAGTGTRKLKTSSFFEYFEPLHRWLKEANRQAKDCVGWGADCEDEAKYFMENEYETEYTRYSHYSIVATWNYETNITTANAENSTKWAIVLNNYTRQAWERRFSQYEFEEFKDESLKRQFRLLNVLGPAALPEDNVVTKMIDQYSSGKICPYKKEHCNVTEEGLHVEPGLKEIVAQSRNYEELKYVWKAWRDATSKPNRANYQVYVKLLNEASRGNKFSDASEEWILPYETPSFKSDIEDLLKQIEPFYKDLHAYARMKLRKIYKDKIDADTPIPACVLGSMHGMGWENLYDIMAPYPEVGTADVTEELINQGYNVTEMFKTSERFFTSLGLEPMPTSYGPSSMTVRPEGRDVLCHPTAWNFFNEEDFRITICAKISMDDLIIIHHEMGHIQYFIQFKDQPVTFQNGANPGFHEAIGDTLALSVSTPKHLQKIGLLNQTASAESDLNYLMNIAIDKVAFLPYGFALERWRWGVFSGEYPESEWNYRWWKLREQLQGVMPPVVRSEKDFDPATVFHVVANVEFMRYFVAHVLQFQLHKALCRAAGEYDPTDLNKPLYRCDIYNSKAAGQILKTLMKPGQSKPWRETLKEATREDDLDSSAILEYFKPLHDYIKQKIKENNETVGWRSRIDEMFDKGLESIQTEEKPTQIDPAIVGAILGVLGLVVVVGYFVRDAYLTRKRNKTYNHRDNAIFN